MIISKRIDPLVKINTIDNILLSIVIPTKNRQKYCLEVIKHILSLNLNNTELVIQDNSDEDTLYSDISRMNDNRILYNHISGVISFVDNFSKAIELTRGKYVCMLGDDDTVLPNIVDVVKYAEENNIDAVLPTLISYFWPSDNPIKEEYRNGCLTMMRFGTPKYRQINAINNLRKLVDNGFQEYQSLQVPRIYHGIVKKEVLDNIKHITGAYFSGLTPDMYMSVCLSGIVKNLVVYNNPISISGICPKSGSNDSATGKHTGELRDAPHFKGHMSYDWIKQIPYIYTVETIWAESGMQALKDMGLIDLYNRFDVKKFIIRLSLKYPQFLDRLLNFGQAYGLTKYSFLIGKVEFLSEQRIKRLMQLIKKILTNNFANKYSDISTIQDACKVAYKKLKK